VKEGDVFVGNAVLWNSTSFNKLEREKTGKTWNWIKIKINKLTDNQ